MLPTLAALSNLLRTALLVGGVVMLAVATADWAARTRRLSPFGGLSRFLRGRVDPRLAGIERLVVRTGGHQSATPWWAVFAYIVFALAVLAVAGLLLDAVRELSVAASGGALGMVVLAVHWTFGFFILALIVRAVTSWVPALATSRWTAWSYGATEWMLRPLRRVLPAFGPVDISPIVAYFALSFVRYLVEGVLLGIR